MVDRSNPFEDLERFFERMNRGIGEMPMAPGQHSVSVDVAETDDDVVVTADLPGFEKDEVTISLSERTLSIEADHEESDETVDEEAHYVRRERSQSRLSRTIRLPSDVDEEATRATYQNGVLTVTLPKQTIEAEDDSHHIDIS